MAVGDRDLAHTALAGALLTPAGWDGQTLRVSTANPATARALLQRLDSDVETPGDDGGRREWVGRLPCGLPLVVSTPTDLPPPRLPAGGDSDGA